MKETHWIVGCVGGDVGENPRELLTFGRYTYRGILEWCNNYHKKRGVNDRVYWVIKPAEDF